MKIDVFEEIRRLREQLEHERRQRQEWQRKYNELKKELDEVKKLLNQFLNSNTPSSQLPFSFRPSPNRDPKGMNPRGKPKGSNGDTKEMPEKIDKKIKVKIRKKCKNCKKKLKIDSYTQLVYDMPKISINVTEFIVEEGYCKHCGILYTGTHPSLPQEGMIGPNLQAFLTELRHNFAGSYERISQEQKLSIVMKPRGLLMAINGGYGYYALLT